MRCIKIRSEGRLAIGVLAVAVVLLLLAGCGGSKGPIRYSLSGKVTYRGAAVPHGVIFFLPDKAKGNDGPAVSVPILDGAYKTLPGRGPTGGPYVATVTSFESNFPPKLGPDRKPPPEPLFPPFQVSIDLPKQDSTHDFVVPAPEE